MKKAMKPWLDNQVRSFVRAALDEDIGSGDITSIALISPKSRVNASIIARGNYVICGSEIVRLVCRMVDAAIACRIMVPDGARARAGAPIMELWGRARSILAIERTALNFMQRMTGIATLTARYVAAVKPYDARILDTRKTTPNMRGLEKYAVKCGGGCNHRMGLYDMILIKDNHRSLWQKQYSPFFARKPCGLPQGGSSVAEAAMEDKMGFLASQGSAKMPRGLPRGASLAEAVRTARSRYPKVLVEIEVESESQLKDALHAAPDWIMLDNMKPALMKRCVNICAGRCKLEASGGITLKTARLVAATGVDAISIGSLTHSAPAADLSLEVSD